MSQVIANHIVQRIIETDDDAAIPPGEDIDWTPDATDPDAPTDLTAHTDAALDADWRWRAWHELKTSEDQDAEMPDLETIPPSHQDEFEIELNGITYHVLRNEEVGEQQAKAQVRQQLEDEPELFTQDWLKSHISTERLTEILWEDQQNMLRDQYESEEEWRDYLIENGKLEQDEFFTEDGDELPIDHDLSAKIDEAKDAWIEGQKDDFDGMSWLSDIYGEDEVMKEAIRIAGIDIDAATDDAVSTDGWPHFISRYDGKSHTLPGGAVYYRD